MLTNYIEAAMRHAQYEALDDGTVYGEIPGLPSVWGNAPTQTAYVGDQWGGMAQCHCRDLQVSIVKPLAATLKEHFERPEAMSCLVIIRQHSHSGQKCVQRQKLLCRPCGALRTIDQFTDADCCYRKH